MTDVTMSRMPYPNRRVDVSPAAVQARVRARYRAETRFRAYGLAALVITTVFVAVLIADVMTRGVPAFWQHSLALEVPVGAEIVAPAGKTDATTIRGADYYLLTRRVLDTAIPGIEGRNAQKLLTRLLSIGAADALRERLVAEPS
ncbi:MAG TPA: DUF3333 domain-containing protein, partial [Hyphomicrobiaceae bacterium]|nr:DUF3333 domain-containing protein [Hyphomicrobiaceae bacterium]